MNVLFVGDIFGSPGRKAVKRLLPGLVEKHDAGLVVANGENSAGGFGITEEVADDLYGMGVQVITTGNHVWDKREVMEYLERAENLVRPANYPAGCPGRGSVVVSVRGVRVGILNLIGRVYNVNADCPFRKAEAEIERLKKEEEAEVVLIDMHAEATSEKQALAWHLDGKVAAIIGTHTHIQTADERLMPGGTAYITDVGMTGPRDSVIGVSPEKAIYRFLTAIPTRFDVAKGPAQFQAVVVSTDPDTGLSKGIKRINIAEA